MARVRGYGPPLKPAPHRAEGRGYPRASGGSSSTTTTTTTTTITSSTSSSPASAAARGPSYLGGPRRGLRVLSYTPAKEYGPELRA